MSEDSIPWDCEKAEHYVDGPAAAQIVVRLLDIILAFITEDELQDVLTERRVRAINAEVERAQVEKFGPR